MKKILTVTVCCAGATVSLLLGFNLSGYIKNVEITAYEIGGADSAGKDNNEIIIGQSVHTYEHLGLFGNFIYNNFDNKNIALGVINSQIEVKSESLNQISYSSEILIETAVSKQGLKEYPVCEMY
jgi:hypothetical protein